MRFGMPIEADRLTALLRPGPDVGTVITADVYGTGDADRAVGTALDGLDRSNYLLVGMVGHDFVHGERQGAKGFPRFTDPALRGPDPTPATCGRRPSAACSGAASTASTS